MSWPTSFDTFSGTTAQGGSLLTAPDHAQDHRTLGSFAGTAENIIGLGVGTPKVNTFLQGIGGGSSQWGTVGTALTFASSNFNNGTAGTLTLQAPTINGQGTNSGTISGGVIGTATIQGGTGISMTLGTPAIDVINARSVSTGVGFNNSIFPSEGTLVDSAGGTLAVDARAAQIYYCVLGTAAGNRTIGTPSNLSNYQLLTFAFKNSGSQNGTLVWSSIFRFNTGGTPVLGTGNTWNYYGFRYNFIDSKLDQMGVSQF